MDLCFAVMWANLWQTKLRGKETLAMFTRVVIISSLFMAAKCQYQILQASASLYQMSIPDEQRDLNLKTDGAEYLPACYEIKEGDKDKLITRDYAEQNLLAAKMSGRPNVYYYPFLSAKISGRQIPIACDPQTGLIKYDAATNSKQVKISPQALPIEKIAEKISLASLIMLIALAFLSKFLKYPEKLRSVGNLPQLKHP